MRTRNLLVAAAFALAGILTMSACGQAGPLYLPDQDSSHKDKALKRQRRAAAQGNKPPPKVDPNLEGEGGEAPPAPAPDNAPAPRPSLPQSTSPTTGAPASIPP